SRGYFAYLSDHASDAHRSGRTDDRFNDSLRGYQPRGRRDDARGAARTLRRRGQSLRAVPELLAAHAGPRFRTVAVGVSNPGIGVDRSGSSLDDRASGQLYADFLDARKSAGRAVRLLPR